MPTTYTPLATSTLSSSSPTVTFSGISGFYTDLVLIVNAQSTQATTYDNLIIQFNSDTGTNYSRQRLNGFSGGATADRSSNATSLGIGAITGTSFSSSIFSPNIIQIQNYSNTTTFKTALWRNNSQDAYVQAGVGTWRNTNAITSISIKTASGSNLAAGCTFSLYGVASASVAAQGAKATGGDTIATDGTYWYHAFKASGTFTPTQSLTADVLVVAGGGGTGASTGGNYVSGGGGAGGYLKHTSQSLTTTNYTITVGAGGAGATVGTNNGNKGSNSQFASLTASVGGGLGGANTGGTNSGGSGGGSNVGSSGGAATSGQGNPGGGGGPGASNYTGGGGGGAGSAGAAGTSTNGGNGGAGTNADSSWLLVTGLGVNGYVAGGGGGASWGPGQTGTGGSGGGGLGGGNTTQGAGIAGTVNTGSGAGGGGNNTNGANGGSGLIIVRYPV